MHSWLDALFPACCAALTELVLNDTNAHQVVQVSSLGSKGGSSSPFVVNRPSVAVCTIEYRF